MFSLRLKIKIIGILVLLSSVGFAQINAATSPLLRVGNTIQLGVVDIPNGGTGANTRTKAINRLLPSQIGQNGRFLITNGSDVSWQEFNSLPVPALTQTQLDLKANAADFVRFNNIVIDDSSAFNHLLSTKHLDVRFYEKGYKEISIIDWYPDTNNSIKVYLPYRDKPTKYRFVGDLYIVKRY